MDNPKNKGKVVRSLKRISIYLFWCFCFGLVSRLGLLLFDLEPDSFFWRPVGWLVSSEFLGEFLSADTREEEEEDDEEEVAAVDSGGISKDDSQGKAGKKTNNLILQVLT